MLFQCAPLAGTFWRARPLPRPDSTRPLRGRRISFSSSLTILDTGDFGCYGQKLIRTPNVDRVAAEGRRFTDCYAGGAVCAPSRSALMTGLHTGPRSRARERRHGSRSPAEDFTVAEVLKKAGYATGGFGKWGLGDVGSTGVPTRHGFDEFFGYLHQVHAHNYYTDFLWDNDRKFPLPGNARRQARPVRAPT